MKKRRRIVWLAALILLALAGASMLLSKYGLEVTRLELGFNGAAGGLRRLQNSPAERPARARASARTTKS